MTLETLSIDSEDVLGTNYIVTSLTVSNYNPTIDSTVTVTVTLKDVYNDPVVGEEVLVTASDGTFTQLNGSNITAASSVTGTTNNNGQFTLTYACSEWGLITFSANNESTHIKVQSVQIQHISTSSKSCGSLYSVEVTATVTSCPSGYSYLFISENNYRSVARLTSLSGTTASFEVTNINNGTQNVSAKGWLIYYPNNFNI